MWLFSDHLGSTSKAATSNGTVSYTSLYKAWGETRYTSGTTFTTYSYTGQREEASFGLYYYNARWYDPQLGRFAQADNVVPEGVQELDRYGYVNNNPVKYTDPSGHRIILPPIWPNGHSIINMSGWSSAAKILISIALAATVDNITCGRTGVYGDSNWGIIPDVDYYNSGAWAVPPVFGGVVSNGDDFARIGTNAADDASSIFTGWNFRKNLQKLTGADLTDIAGKEAHHILPQQYVELFEKIGININDPKYGTWVDAKLHRTWSWEYNQKWAEFFGGKIR